MVSLNSLFDLKNKVALVTGASSGLGRRAAIVLSAAGAKVIGVARRRDALEDLRKEIVQKVCCFLYTLKLEFLELITVYFVLEVTLNIWYRIKY